MNILIIDTSTERSFLALILGGKLAHYQELEVGLHSSQHLMVAVQQSFEACNFESDNLTAIAVGVGPGSFTGIRVGVSFAKGLAFVKKIPLIPLDSLTGYVSEKMGKFASLIDARMGVYLSIRKRDKEGITDIEKSHFTSYSTALLKIHDCIEIITPYAPHLREKMPSLILEARGVSINYLMETVRFSFLNKIFVSDGNLPLSYLRHGDYQKITDR